MPALAAARLEDPIGHTNALLGVLIGALAGVAVAVTIVAIVGTGGVAAVAIGAGIVAAAAGGGLSGESIGEVIPTSPTGRITKGSLNVTIGSKFAARAGLDMAACSGVVPLFPHASPLIAQGSSTVLINGMMAARRTDKLVCGAAVAKGLTSVVIGGTTMTVAGLTIDSDMPRWLTVSLWVLMVAGTVIATGGAVVALGWGVAIGGLVGGIGGGFLGGEFGGWAGREIGGFFGNAELGERIGTVTGGVLGGLLGGYYGGKYGGQYFPKQSPVADTPPADSATPNEPPAESTDISKAEKARDDLGKAQGRKSAAYTGGAKEGRVVTGQSSNPTGCAEDDVARQLGPDAKYTKAYGWRTNKSTGELEWKEIPVCKRCQSKYSPDQFPPDVQSESGGQWEK